ncbi:MAG: ATP-binding protein, partial [Cyclobacteriaceae bacterium]
VHTNKGYGLGLSYVDSVVKAHKATIELESVIGKGSTFIIKFKK